MDYDRDHIYGMVMDTLSHGHCNIHVATLVLSQNQLVALATGDSQTIVVKIRRVECV